MVRAAVPAAAPRAGRPPGRAPALRRPPGRAPRAGAGGREGRNGRRCCGGRQCRHPDHHLPGLDDGRRRPAGRGRCRRFGGVVGKRRVQRWRRNPFGRFGSADHDPVPRRILHEVCGVAGRDHADLTGGLGKRGCSLRLQHVALEGLLLLHQRLVGLPGTAQLIRPLRRVGRQPQRDPEAQSERSDDQHHERDAGGQRARVEVDRRNPGHQTDLQWRPNDLGRLGLPRLRPGLCLAGVLRPDRLDLGPDDRCGLGCARTSPPGWRVR